MVIVWGVEGWRWYHGAEVGPGVFEVWQEAASAAVSEAGARPRR